MSKFASQSNSHNPPVVPKDGVFSKISWLTLAIGSSVLLTPQIAISQPITPETGANGTGTTITTPDGQQFDINGGARSGDGANLFHSFQQFGLNQGQTANFISNPQIQNILGRVVGGDPSIINGLIQITGGNSNLFLMNPAGILFGPNASLNIPADFTATTASGIGFGNGWFNAFGTSDYASLVETPSAFSFNMSQLGTIINEGNLTLTNGSNLNLFANTVINTGTLSTPGGNINITAIPNGNTLRISQPGHLLSLEIVPTDNNNQTLPQLLTGGDRLHHATTVEKLEDGTIRLTGSQTPIPLEPGITVVSGNMSVATEQMTNDQGQMTILGDKIALIGANIDASGTNSAGNIHIGGNYQGARPLPNANHTYIDQNTNISANAISSGNGGQIIIWSDNTTQFHGNISATGIENGGFVEVSGKQNLIFRGNVDLSSANGQTGTLLLDPENIYIVSGAGAPDDAEIADEQILWDDPFGFPYGTTYTISEQALESLNGNANVTLLATNDIVIDDLADNELAFQPGFGSINLNADYDNDGLGSFVMSPGDKITALGRSLFITAANIITGSIDTGNTGNVSLYTSWGSIQQADATTQITANHGVFTAPNGIGTSSQPLEINVGKLEVTLGAGGAFLNSPNYGVTLGGISANPAAVAIYNGGTFSLTADGDIIANSGQVIGTDNNSAGNIILTSTNGGINISGGGVGNLNSSYYSGDSGIISLTAANDINIDIPGIFSSSLNGNGGDITITSNSGSVNITNSEINSYARDGNAGTVTIQAAGDINILFPTIISTYSISGNGGNLNINSSNGGINIGNIRSVSERQDAGNIKLEAAGDINTLSMSAYAIGNGGDIDIISHSGNINTSNGQLISFTAAATAGSISLQAAGNITTGLIDAYAQPVPNSNTPGNGGDITINSTGGTVNASAGWLRSYAFYGDAGDVNIEAAGDITTSYITSLTYSPNSTALGGDINITSHNGGINTTAGNVSVPIADTDAIADIANTFFDNAANIDPYAPNGLGGDINLQAKNDIITGHLSSYGGAGSGDVKITSSDRNINTGVIFSVSPQGNGGNITINAPLGDITTSHINSYATQNGSGGFVDISAGGDFSIGAATINSFSGQNTAGDVTINVGGNINLGGDANRSAIRSEGPIRGGNISITSGGEINTALGNLDSYSASGTAGNVTLNGLLDIATNNIRSEGSQVGGDISITSNTGAITAAGNFNSFSQNGTAGDVTLDAATGIDIANIRSEGAQVGGDITVTTGGTFTSDTINSYATDAATGEAGNVTIEAASDITLGGDVTNSAIRSEGVQVGGNISITSTTGAITAAGDLNSFSQNGTAGNVSLDAATGIDIANIRSEGAQVGGDITVTTGGTFTSDTINSYATDAATGEAGNVTIEAASDITLGGDVTNSAIRSEGVQVGGDISITSNTGAITAAGDLNSFSQNGTAGDVTLDAATGIDIANIRSEGAQQGGSIEISSDAKLDLSQTTLNSYSANGTAGDVTITANGDITLGGDATNSAIRSEGVQVGGDISITSTTGEIDATQGRLDSYSSEGTAGNVTLNAAGNITSAAILSDGKQVGGNITITSSSGDIDVSRDNLESYSSEGTAGNVTLTAPGDIKTEDIISDGRQIGGNITIRSTSGQIDASSGNLYSFSEGGQAGNVGLNAPGDIATAEIFSNGYEVGGNIDIATNGQIDASAGSLNSYSENGTAGNVTLNAPGNITLGGDANNSAIRSEGLQQGGNISITSANGEVYTRLGNLDSFSNAGIAGNVFVRANGDVNTASIRSEGAKQGGSIVILSFEGNVDTWGNLNSFSSAGTAGDLAIQAQGNINTFGIRSDGYVQGGLVRLISSNGAINTSWGTLDSYSIAGTAGSVLLEAPGSITTGAIRSEGLRQGGSISITSYGDAINTTAGNLQSFSSNGTAGNVNLNAPGKITTASIISHGRFVGGNISINSGSDEGIDTTAGVLETYSTDGNAGNVTLTAPGDIVTGGGGYLLGDGSGCVVVGAPCLPPQALGANGEVLPGVDDIFGWNGQYWNLGSGIRSQGWLRGGKIEIISNGNINTSRGHLDSYSENGVAGDVTIEAGGSFTASNITSYGNFQSGNVGIFSRDGGIRTGTLRTISPNGTSGNVTLNTFSHQGDIITADITSEGGLAAGNIEALAPDGTITTGDLTSRSVLGDAGDITVAAGGDVETGDISSLGGGNSGDITVTSTGGNVTTGDIASIAETGSAGDITVGAFGDVNTGTITSSGATGDGNISVTSVTGTVNGRDVSVQPQPGQSESVPNQPPVVNPAPANSSVASITNNNPVVSPEMNIPDAPVNLPVTDIVTRIVSEGANVSNINNSVVLRPESNGSSGGDSSGEISLSSGSADVAKTISVLSSSPLAVATSDAAVAALDKSRESEFEEYFGSNLGQNLTSTASTREAIVKIAEETGYKSAIIYVMAQPEQLELIVMMGTGQPIRKTVPEAPREKLLEVVSQFRSQLTVTRLGQRTDGYRKPAQQLYQWLIAPIEAELQAAGINTLLLSMDSGLRSLPMAALYDGQQFLVEKYSMSQIPSISLVDTNYRTLKDTRVLAMGASTFTELNPLPAVPVELSTISEKLWSGMQLINENFTEENLISERKKYPYPIIHLATHGEFQAGTPENSYIQLWGDEKLRLNQLRELGWHNPAVELLVLSACRTALGNEQAEMGFAGLAVQAGVKTALASLWSVSDEGTLALMTEFYRHLENAKD